MERMAQRQKESQCFKDGSVLSYGVWFCREHAPHPSPEILNPDDRWECSAEDPFCEQLGCTRHSGLWFCKDHALLETQDPPTEDIMLILREVVDAGTKSGRAMLVAISFFTWW